MNLSGAKGVKAPGEDEKNWEMSENDQAVDPKEETHFRAPAARANYLALDRMDLQYVTKEVCRGMAAPTRGHVKKLRRLIRYFVEAPRVVTEYKFQGDEGDGGVIRQQLGRLQTDSEIHQRWSHDEGHALLEELDWYTEERDLEQRRGRTPGRRQGQWRGARGAAVDVVSRSHHDGVHQGGLVCSGQEGKRQIASCQCGTSLGATGRRRRGGLKYHKVNGEENPSDACTKHLTGERLRKLVARAGQCQSRDLSPGRHPEAVYCAKTLIAENKGTYAGLQKNRRTCVCG